MHDQPHLAERQALVAVGKMFFDRSWSLATSSNYSAVVGREPTRLLLTASGKHKGELTPDDFVLVDAAGKAVEPGAPKPSAETLLHCVLAELPHVGSILHTHSVWGTVLSEKFHHEGELVLTGFEMLKGLEGITTHEHALRIPIFENTQHIPDLAEQVRAKLHDPAAGMTHAFLIRRHGLYTWGRNVLETRRHVETLEFLFEVFARLNDVR